MATEHKTSEGELRLTSPYQDWARSLDEQTPEPRFASEELLEPLIVKLIVGRAFPSLREARRWLWELVAEGVFLLDGFERDRLLAELERDEEQKVDQERSEGEEPGAIYSLYRRFASPDQEPETYPGRLDVLEIGSPIEAAQSPRMFDAPPESDFSLSSTQPIVATIDDGIGFLNNRFRFNTGDPGQRQRTRFHAVWIQAFRTILIPGFGKFYILTGAVLHQSEIDMLLARGDKLDEEAVYRSINSVLIELGEHRSTEYQFTHGTHVLDIAAGADPEGNAPEQHWPLIAVQLPPEAVDNTAGTQLEPLVVQGVRWILYQAEQINGDSPVVINVSLGTLAGPKDGTKPIEYLVARELREWQTRTGRCARVVYSFGNDRLGRQVARFDIPAEEHRQIDWRILPDDYSASFAEIRPVDGADLEDLDVGLTAPNGASIPPAPLPPNTYRTLLNADGFAIARLYHVGVRFVAPGAVTPAYYLLAVAPTAPVEIVTANSGAWQVEVCNSRGTCEIPVRLEAQRGDTPIGYRQNGRQSYFDHPDAHEFEPDLQAYSRPANTSPIKRAGTHSSFVTAVSEQVYSVGAAVDSTATQPAPGAPLPPAAPAIYSSEGASWTIPGPTLSALADDAPRRGLLASGTFSSSVRALNGTSVAAGRVTHALATLFSAEGCDGQPPASGSLTNEAAELIARFGEPRPPQVPEARLGHGTITAQAGNRRR